MADDPQMESFLWDYAPSGQLLSKMVDADFRVILMHFIKCHKSNFFLNTTLRVTEVDMMASRSRHEAAMKDV